MPQGPDAGEIRRASSVPETLIPGRRAFVAAVLGYCVAARIALADFAGNPAGQSFAAQLPVWERTLPLHAHTLALSLALIHHSLRRLNTHGGRESGIVVFITVLSCLSGALTATGRVPARLDAFGALSRPLKIVTWLFTTPAMLLLIANLAGATRTGAVASIVVDLAMLACGLLAQTTPAPWAYGFAAVGLLLLLPLLFALQTMFTACLSRLPAGSMRNHAVQTCAVTSLVLWSGFAVIFVFSCTGQLSHRAAAVLWAITDVAAKACFSMTLLLSSTVTVEESLDEAARAAHEARTRQLAQLCHEIRNPLFGVIGNLQELDFEICGNSTEVTLLPPHVTSLVATTMACTAQLRRTLDDFLDLAKADAATLRVVRGPTLLRPLLVDVSRQVLRAAHDKGLTVFVHTAPSLADKVFLLDAGRVSQVLSNFAWNAVKFTASGSITLRASVDGGESCLEVEDSSQGELQLLFEVVDTGFGISEEAQQRLFLPFQTVHTDPTNVSQKWGGTGLGLSICKVIGELLGGTVGVTSAKDAGSTFWLRTRAEWWADPSGAGSAELGTSIASGTDHVEQVIPQFATNELRRRRVSAASRVSSSVGDDAAANLPLKPSNFSSRRHSLDAWTQQARRELGAVPAVRRISADHARSPAGSLAEQLAAVAEAHAIPGSTPPDGTQSSAEAVSSALLATLRTLRHAVGEAEVAVACRLAEPAAEPAQQDGRRGSSLDLAALGNREPEPAAEEPPPAASSPPSNGDAAPSSVSWPGPLRRVLVVDDEPINTRLVSRRLERVVPDVAVTVADDGLDMVDLCVEQKQRYDVVLLDQHMRGMNGDAAVAALRAYEQAAALPRLLVLACTGNSSAQDVERFDHAGFDGVITKPLDLNALVPSLAALISDRDAAIDGIRMFSLPEDKPA